MFRESNSSLTRRVARTVWPLCVLCVAHGAPAMGAAVAPITFEGAHIGMSQADWRSLPPPSKLAPHAQPKCSNDPDTTGLTLTDTERYAGVVVCAYVDAWGKLSLPVAFTFDHKSPLDHLRYWFAGGRLTQIRAAVALDSFDTLNSNFTRTYGPPVKLVRDNVPSEIGPLPRVTETWSTPQGSIDLVDPILPNDEIGLRFVAASQDAPPHALKSARR